MSRFLDAARDLAERGYYVFPCRERSKAPATKHGFRDGSRDERQILHWWTGRPLNVAVACEASGIAVLDIDPKHGADPAEVLATLDLDPDRLVAEWTGEAPEPSAEYPRSLAGLRGLHGVFRGTTSTGELSTGVEIRSRGAYVVCAPSAHPSGVAYRWHRRSQPPRVDELPELPARLVPARPTARPAPTSRRVEPGQRHSALVAIAVDLIARGVTETDLLRGALVGANAARCRPPLDLPEVEAIADWAAGSGIANRERHLAEFAATFTRPPDRWWSTSP